MLSEGKTGKCFCQKGGGRDPEGAERWWEEGVVVESHVDKHEEA